MSSCHATPPAAPHLLAQNALGQIHVETNGVVILKISYLSLRLQADAFDALSALVRRASHELADHGLDATNGPADNNSATMH